MARISCAQPSISPCSASWPRDSAALPGRLGGLAIASVVLIAGQQERDPSAEHEHFPVRPKRHARALEKLVDAAERGTALGQERIGSLGWVVRAQPVCGHAKVA